MYEKETKFNLFSFYVIQFSIQKFRETEIIESR